jgi:hypothetical protein
MSTPNSPQIQSELDALKKDMNEYLTTELHFILQPEYRSKNKARQLLDTLLKLVGPVEHVLEKPQYVHDTLLDDGLKVQKDVMEQLKKDFTAADDQQALGESVTHLNKVVELIKHLRQEVPRS